MKSKTQFSIVCILLLIIVTNLTSCKKNSSSISHAAANISNDAVADSTIDSSLVAWYTFDNGDLTDKSGKGNDIVFSNAKTTSGKKGTPRSAYSFNGSSDYMEVANSSSLNPSSQISLVVLFKPKGYYPGSTTRIFMKGADDQSNGVYFLGYNNDGSLYGTYGDNQFQSNGAGSAANSFQLNKWYKLVYTYNSKVGKLFINDNLVSKVAKTAIFTPNTFPLRIGTTGRSDFPYFFNGVIDEIRIYNTALTASQVVTVDSQLGQ